MTESREGGLFYLLFRMRVTDIASVWGNESEEKGSVNVKILLSRRGHSTQGCWRMDSDRKRCLLSSEERERKESQKERKAFSIALFVMNWLWGALGYQGTSLNLCFLIYKVESLA